MGDKIHSVNPAVILVEDEVWNWSKARVMKDVVKLATLYGNENNRGLMYTPKQGDVIEEVDTAMVLIIPAGLVEWMMTTPRTLWELHQKISVLITEMVVPNTPPELELCLGWCLKACQIKMGDTGCSIFPPTLVLSINPGTIGWTKQRLETTTRTKSAPTL